MTRFYRGMSYGRKEIDEPTVGGLYSTTTLTSLANLLYTIKNYSKLIFYWSTPIARTVMVISLAYPLRRKWDLFFSRFPIGANFFFAKIQKNGTEFDSRHSRKAAPSFQLYATYIPGHFQIYIYIYIYMNIYFRRRKVTTKKFSTVYYITIIYLFQGQ